MSVAARASSYRTAPRHFAWLLWLALLLPIGQMAAMCHAVSHIDLQTTRKAESDTGLPDTPCELCLIAAALGSGGLRGAPLHVPDPSTRHEVPQGAFDSAWLPLPAQAYLSRAPPFSVPH